jgi:preprotein translocase subunit SecG
MAVVSILARSARQATLYAMIIWVALSLLFSFLRNHFREAQLLDWALPGSQVSSLRWLTGWETLALAPVPIVHTVLFLAIGAVLMQRRDL